MVDSIHVARWISQFEPSEVEFTLFPSTPNRRVHSLIKELMVSNGNIKIVPFGGKLSIPLWGLDLIFSNIVRGYLLRRSLIKQPPDFLHALEFQHAGYIAIRALKDQGIKTKFIATNYGSDIFWFQQFRTHFKKIQKILERADRYSAECNRDVQLARKLGFKKQVLPVFPNSGALPLQSFAQVPINTDERKIIAIKGYEGWAGKASAAIDAIYLLAKDLEEHEIVFYSCNWITIRRLRKLKKQTNLTLMWHKKGAMAHQHVLELFAKSKLYIGISRTDGISTSLMEAMAMGAFPLQTCTACTSEWFEDGQTGISVKSLDPTIIAKDISTALGMGKELRVAAAINREKVILETGDDKQLITLQKFYDLKAR